MIQYTIKQIATHNGIKPERIRRWRRDGLVPSHLITVDPSTGHVRYNAGILEWVRAKMAGEVTPEPTPPVEPGAISIDATDDHQTLTTKSHTIRSLDDALQAAKIDLTTWEVERYIVNTWEMGSVIDGVAQALPLHQVKVWLKRRVTTPTASALESILSRIAERAPSYPPVEYALGDNPHLLEVSIADHHIGKLAWRRETGEDYDIPIAERLYENAVIDLMRKSHGFQIGRVLLPVGNDFLHIDNLESTTTHGTPQDTDGRYARIVEAGQMALIRAIDRLRQVAPVDVLLVPGNHDQVSSWSTARFLWAYYRNCDDVIVNCEPIARKYYKYGTNLIGFTHGSEEKHASLPVIMATESAHSWADTSWHEWHIGHFHKQKETQYVGVDCHDGVLVRILPSLTRRDEWHFSKGYLGTKLAEAFLYSFTDGPTGYVCTRGN